MELNIITKEELEIFAQRLLASISELLKGEPNDRQMHKNYTSSEACKYLNVCTKTLQNYRDNGLLAFTQIGRKICYTHADLNAFLREYKKDTFQNQLRNRRNAK
jgi:excisionase family DNA binding protein